MSEIDDLRQQMAQMQARLSHLEAHGVPPPSVPPTQKVNGELTSRLDAAYMRRHDKLKGQLIGLLSQQYAELAHGDNLRDALPSNSADPTTGQEYINALPRMIAAELTRETMVRGDLESAQRAHALRGGGNEGKIARLQVELAAVTSHTQMLLTSARGSLPMVPQALHHAIASLGQSRHTTTLPVHAPRTIRG